MTKLRVLAARLLALVTQRRRDVELNEEIEAHLDLLTEEHVRRGMSPDHARAAARRAFGGVEQVKEAYRDQRGRPIVDALVRDVRYGVRTMRRAPGFTAVAIVTLTIGIGANTAMFSLADALVLKPLPVDRPGELRVVKQVFRVGGIPRKWNTLLPYQTFQALRGESGVFSDVLGFAHVDDIAIEVGGREIRAEGGVAFVSDNYFAALGVQPRLGRAFLADEQRTAAPSAPSAVLSHRFWKRAFSGSGEILGEVIRFGGSSFTVVGVTPPEFFGAVLGRAADLFLPLAAMGASQPGLINVQEASNWRVHVIGRLERDVADTVAAERLTQFARTLTPAESGLPAPLIELLVIELLPVETGLSDVRAILRRPFAVLMTMVGLLLFVACANVALMLLSRSAARRTEIAIRVAMGAGRRRLLQQLITEGMLLAFAAGTLGLLLARWATDLLLPLLPAGDVPLTVNLSVDFRVLLFTAATSLVAALLFALAPAARVLHADATSSLTTHERGRTIDSFRLGAPLVAAQVAISLLILVGAALLVRTLHGLATLAPGFKTEGVLLITVDPGSRGYAGTRLHAYYRDLLDRLASLPGVASVTLSQFGFLAEGRTTGTVDVPGFMPASEDERWVQVFQVGPGFFETLGIRVIQGRDFTPQDMTGGPAVAAINETAARRYFGRESPLGSTLKSDGEFQIVAVVQDARYNALRDIGDAALFVPYGGPHARGRMVVTARTTGDRDAATATVMRETRALDPLVPVRAAPLQSVLEKSLSRERVLAIIAAFFAATALLLMAVGLFGVVAFRVQQRTAEIGVRLALGARGRQVIWLVLQQPMRLALLGLAIGIPATLASTRVMRSLLFGLSPRDVPTIMAATAGVLLIVAAAVLLPARRAARLDPLAALRQE